MDFARHLPPSLGLPRVLALDESAAAALPGELDLVAPAQVTFSAEAPPFAPNQFDAVVGYCPPVWLRGMGRLLRPGGRLILAHRGDPAPLLEALVSVDLVHCLVERVADYTLYRGERPRPTPSLIQGPTPSRSAEVGSPFVYLLVTQTPARPAWSLAPGERLEWRAATVIDPAGGQPALLAFTSLVRAVRFVQRAVLAAGGPVRDINKVGKFRAEVAGNWDLPLIVDADFESVRTAEAGPAYAVDPQTAVAGEE